MKSIGEVAARFGLPAHVLRYWEAEGLLTPARVGDRRRYADADADVRRVAAVLVAKEAGFELADIRSMLTDRSAAGRAAMAARQRERLRTRIARAQAALELLEGDCRHDDLMTCPHFQTLLDRQLERS